MAALAIAMLLTGAGAVDAADQRRRSPPPPPQSMPTIVLPPPRPPPPRPPRPSLPTIVRPPLRPPPPPPPPPPRRPLPQREAANLGAYFSDADYPVAAKRAREQGIVGFRLLIERDGEVAHCQVTRSSGSAALDVATCQILKARARYNPARDAAGNAVRSIDEGQVSWVLSDD